MMDDLSSDESLEDFSWDPELKKIYDDVAWATGDPEIVPEMDHVAQQAIAKIGFMSYPEILVNLFDDKPMVRDPEKQAEMMPENPSYPHKSSLTLKEMRRFVKLEKLYKRTQSISEVSKDRYKEYKDYKALQAKVLKEQEEYQRYLYETAVTSIAKYNYVDAEAVKYVRLCMNASQCKVTRYQRYYVHLRDFGILFVPFKNDTLPAPITNFVKTLGNQKRLSSVSHTTNVPKNINTKKNLRKTAALNEVNYWQKCPISEDINAQRLAIAWNADIVISLGSLQALADNHQPFKNEWEMPVVVRTYEGLEYGLARKIAFIDKKLPPKCIAPCEKNLRYFKEVFKWLSDFPNAWKRACNSAEIMQSSVLQSTDGNTSDDNEAIMQVDGATDEKPLKLKPKIPMRKVGRHGSVSNASTSKEQSESMAQASLRLWSQPRSLSSFTARDPKTGFGDLFGSSLDALPLAGEASPGFQPFIGMKKVPSWKPIAKRKVSPDKMEERSGGDSDDQEVKETPVDKSSRLSFGVLPDSALSLSQDEGLDKPSEEVLKRKRSGSTKTATVKPEPPDEHLFFTPRRSLRKKGNSKTGDVEASSIDVTKSVLSLLAKASAKPTKKSTPTLAKEKKSKNARSKSGEGSSDETLSAIKKNNLPSITDDKVQNEEPLPKAEDSSNVLSHILPAQFEMETPAAKKCDNLNLASLKPFTPSSDLLGQILGKKTPAMPSCRKDVSSAWALQAQTMRNADSDEVFSADDLALQQLPKDHNVTYALWKFGKKRVLIRYTLHGNLVTPLTKIEKEFQDPNGLKIVPVTLRTKLEYQSDFVYEQMTVSEMCRDWVTMLIKRHSKVVRARIEPFKREMLDVEWTMTMNHLHDKAKQIGYNPAVTAKLLTKVFEMISELGKGTYICCHRENESKLVIRQAVDDIERKVIYDLHKEYSCPGRDVVYSQTVPWLPGDPHKLRKSDVPSKLIPMTFDPKDEADGSFQATSSRSSKRKKKKK